MNKFEYLRKYRSFISLLSGKEVKANLSEDWKEIFEKCDNHERVKKVISLWKKYCAVELRNTIVYLEDNLLSVDFIESPVGTTVLYEIRMAGGSTDYYEGGLPLKNYEEQFPGWHYLPESIQNFYSFIHNGFYYFPSKNMGILSIDSVSCMSDFDWGIIEDLNLTVEIQLNTSYILFESGMGGYVVVDTENSKNDIATVWFSNKKPIYNKNFWDVVDEWIVMGFE